MNVSHSAHMGGHRRVLIALVGLFRHYEAGFREIEQQLIVPTERSGALTKVALYTDPSSACSTKEDSEGRCCVRLPNDIAAAAHALYGRRLLRVRIAEHSSHTARLVDAWSHSLRDLSAIHEATLIIRPDARLTKPLAVFEVCERKRKLPPCDTWCQRMLPKRVAWTAHLACSPHAAASMCSGNSPAPVRSDTLGDVGIFCQLLQCEGSPSEIHRTHEMEHKWVGIVQA
jgi:hypothetical protein